MSGGAGGARGQGRRRGQLPDPGETPRPELCDYCGTERIRWYRTEHNQPMAVDALPDPERGNVRIVTGHAVVFGNDNAAAQRAQGHQLYLNHRVTCPRKDLWPKPVKKTAGKGAERPGRGRSRAAAPEPPPTLF